jgi:hypothetical protein
MKSEAAPILHDGAVRAMRLRGLLKSGNRLQTAGRTFTHHAMPNPDGTAVAEWLT